MEEKREPLGRRRPIIVTLFCALGFIAYPFFVTRMTDEVERKMILDLFGPNHMRIEILTQSGFLVAFVGCWFLKRWGAFLMLALTIASGIYYGMVEPKLLLQWARMIFVALVMLSCLKYMD